MTCTLLSLFHCKSCVWRYNRSSHEIDYTGQYKKLYRSVQILSMAQHKKNTSAKCSILAAAMDLFHRNGVHATGVDEILKSSNTGKSQFYHYFQNKDDLVHAVLQCMMQKLKDGGPGGVLPIQSWKDLEAWFQCMLAFQKSVDCKCSCPIGTIGSEIRNDQTILREDVCEIFTFLQSSIADFFRQQKKAGKLVRACDPESLANFCICVTQGGLLVSKIQRDPMPFEHSVKHALKHVCSFKKKRTD